MKRAGFTLLELIVATTIFAVIVTASYVLFDSGRDLTARAELRAQLFQTARAALRAIEEDVRGAVGSGTAFDTGFVGTNGGTGDLPSDRLEAVAVNMHTVDTSEKKCDLTRVIYSIGQAASMKRPGLVRERQKELTPLTLAAGSAEALEEVAAEVVGVNFRFYDLEWLEEWDSTVRLKLPQAVEATVHVRGEWKGAEVREAFTTRFYLPVAAEAPERQP